jgi:hypothetical protein
LDSVRSPTSYRNSSKFAPAKPSEAAIPRTNPNYALPVLVDWIYVSIRQAILGRKRGDDLPPEPIETLPVSGKPDAAFPIFEQGSENDSLKLTAQRQA